VKLTSEGLGRRLAAIRADHGITQAEPAAQQNVRLGVGARRLRYQGQRPFEMRRRIELSDGRFARCARQAATAMPVVVAADEAAVEASEGVDVSNNAPD